MGAIQFTDRATAVRIRPETRALAQAAAAALPAPSIFNSQPWRWRISKDHAELRADRARQLHAADADGRMLTVSCGIALHHARTSLAARGAEVEVERLPDADDPDLLARVRVIGSRQPDPAAMKLNAVIAVRRTDRRPFADTTVPPEKLHRIRAVAEREGAHLHLIPAEDVVAMTAAAARAAVTEAADPRYHAELDDWTHRGDATADGLDPERHSPAPGLARPVPLRDFTRLPDVPAAGATLTDRFARYLVLFTDADEPGDWLTAGEALSAVLLSAACEGLAASPMSDTVEVPSTRLRLRRLLAGVGHPMVTVRLGVAADDRPAPATPRRAACETIELVDEAR